MVFSNCPGTFIEMLPEKRLGEVIENVAEFVFPLAIPDHIHFIPQRFSWINEDSGSFEAEIGLGIFTELEVRTFMAAFSNLHGVDWKSRRGAIRNTRSFFFFIF